MFDMHAYHYSCTFIWIGESQKEPTFTQLKLNS